MNGWVTVTGYRGFIGHNLITRLNNQRIKWSGIEVEDGFTGGYRDRLLGDLVHLGAVSGIEECERHPSSARQMNVDFSLGYFEHLAATEPERKIIFASSSAIDSGVSSTYRDHKRCVELYLRSFSIASLALRFTNVYGPHSTHKTSAVHQMIRDGLTEGVVTVKGGGLQVRDFIYVDDVVDAIMLALEMDPDQWEKPFPSELQIGTTVGIDLETLGAMVAELTGAKLQLESGDDRSKSVATDEAAAWLNFQAETKLADGLRKTVNWYEELLGKI